MITALTYLLSLTFAAACYACILAKEPAYAILAGMLATVAWIAASFRQRMARLRREWQEAREPEARV